MDEQFWIPPRVWTDRSGWPTHRQKARRARRRRRLDIPSTKGKP